MHIQKSREAQVHGVEEDKSRGPILLCKAEGIFTLTPEKVRKRTLTTGMVVSVLFLCCICTLMTAR